MWQTSADSRHEIPAPLPQPPFCDATGVFVHAWLRMDFWCSGLPHWDAGSVSDATPKLFRRLKEISWQTQVVADTEPSHQPYFFANTHHTYTCPPSNATAREARGRFSPMTK